MNTQSKDIYTLGKFQAHSYKQDNVTYGQCYRSRTKIKLELNSTDTGTEITLRSSLHESAKQPTPTTLVPGAYWTFLRHSIQSKYRKCHHCINKGEGGRGIILGIP